MSPPTLRICLLTYRGNPRSGGQGIYVRHLSRELRDMGHRVEVWSGPPYPELHDGVRLVEVPSLDLWADANLRKLPPLRRLNDRINVEEWLETLTGTFAEPRAFTKRVARTASSWNGDVPFDVVHDNQSLGTGLLELRKKVPVVTTIHHPITRDRKVAIQTAPNLYRKYGIWRWYGFLGMQARVARAMDRVLTVSEAAAADIQEDFGIEPRKMRDVGNGIDLSVFHPLPDVAREENRILTTLSADVPLKGFGYLLEALAELRSEFPELRLTVIGSPRSDSGTAEKVAKLGLEGIVEFTGRVTAEEIARRYARTTMAVVSSLYEGFGFPAGEAMACEVPLVSTRGGALPEVVGPHGEAGLLVEPGSTAALAEAIAEVLRMPAERRRALGEAGRRRVESLFTWRRAAERHVEFYREAIEERQLEASPSWEPIGVEPEEEAAC